MSAATLPSTAPARSIDELPPRLRQTYAEVYQQMLEAHAAVRDVCRRYVALTEALGVLEDPDADDMTIYDECGDTAVLQGLVTIAELISEQTDLLPGGDLGTTPPPWPATAWPIT